MTLLAFASRVDSFQLTWCSEYLVCVTGKLSKWQQISVFNKTVNRTNWHSGDLWQSMRCPGIPQTTRSSIQNRHSSVAGWLVTPSMDLFAHFDIPFSDYEVVLSLICTYSVFNTSVDVVKLLGIMVQELVKTIQ